MKTKILFTLSICALMLSSCEKQIPGFDKDLAFIYFNMPFPLDAWGRPSNLRVDSLYYSFGLDDKSVTEAVIKVPVNILGVTFDVDREYKVEVDLEKTTATDEDWDRNSIATTVIRKGEMRDTLNVRVFRSEASEKAWLNIVLRIVSNENFEAGYNKLVEAKISFTSELAPPWWWAKWINYIGAFSREKYIKWQEIYYEGADPNLNYSIVGEGYGKPLYWDNMPSYPSMRDYPSTLMFLNKLRQYFLENEVYPDGDMSKPRITVPDIRY